MSEEAPDDQPPRRRSSLLPWLLVTLAVAAAIGYFAFRIAESGFVFTEGDLPRLIGLLAILAFLAVGLVGRQMRVWHIIRAMLAWALIIFVVAGLYASRDHLAVFAGRLMGALVPGVPVSGRLAGEANPDSVVITRAGDGHFAVRASVDGVATTMLIDTGASFVTLSHEDALRVGIDPATLRYSIPIRTANGTMQAAGITLDSLAIGAIGQRDVRALVAPPGSLSQSLLGMSFLDALHGYAISGDRLVLTP
ncbi:MAG: TIGR02281 family clan AA aspartic protease [Rhizobiales bacterium]|nr:TIGR02281 family clan AA aspartic protease [Hyphomicrobiales bacterium]